MINRNGIIAATTKHGMETPVVESDLFIHPPFFILSSRPHEIQDMEQIGITTGLDRLEDRRTVWDASSGEAASVGTGVARLKFRTSLYDFEAGREAAGIETGVSRLSFKSVLTIYDRAEPEPITLSTGVSRLELKKTLVVYDSPEPEQVTVSTGISRLYLNGN